MNYALLVKSGGRQEEGVMSAIIALWRKTLKGNRRKEHPHMAAGDTHFPPDPSAVHLLPFDWLIGFD